MSEPTPSPTTALTVDDPLSGQEVTIAVTLPGSDRPREGRPVLVSVGRPGATPALQTGTFGDLMPLIKAAWLAAATQLEKSSATAAADSDHERSDENPPNAGNNDGDDTTIATAPVTIPDKEPAPPAPQISNLKLF